MKSTGVCNILFTLVFTNEKAQEKKELLDEPSMLPPECEFVLNVSSKHSFKGMTACLTVAAPHNNV